VRLVSLYSNDDVRFTPIAFNESVSAVLAEIRIPANRDLDTHNLGKTTVGSLIDFCLLKGKDPKFFLFKHENVFGPFSFYLEIALPGPRYVTIRRPVLPGSKVDFLVRSTSTPDATGLPEYDWDHLNVPSDRARLLLEGLLEIDGYLIRTQQDYQDVFQLGKFSGKHQDWKPFVAHLLGSQSGKVTDLYNKRTERDQAQSELAILVREWGNEESDPSLIEGLLASTRRQIAAKTETLDGFNFRGDQLDDRIVRLNDEHYGLRQVEARISESREHRRIIFDPKAAKTLFEEAGVTFSKQLERDYDQLIEFNRAITHERQQALLQQLEESRQRIAGIEGELVELNAERARSLSFLRQSDSLAKYKQTSKDLAKLQVDLAVLEQRRHAAARLAELRRHARTLSAEFDRLQTEVEDELAELSKDEDGRFGQIRRYFGEIISKVIGEQAILSMTLNNQGGIEFHAELVGATGVATSGDKGTSYRKLLCIAFDLAVLRAYLDVRFPRFVYLDGALEQLEPRKRGNLIEVFREYAAAGLQPIISLLDSDLPAPLGESTRTLTVEDVVLTLHDEGDDGRLFKIPAW
jgi:uncharacterized protein YydD (DUF2326 family)